MAEAATLSAKESRSAAWAGKSLDRYIGIIVMIRRRRRSIIIIIITIAIIIRIILITTITYVM